MEPFIYVFSKEDKDQLLANGYHLLKADEKNNVYIFERSDSKFEQLGVTFLLSKTLTF